MVGAYYRLHQSHSLATVGGAAATCQLGSATDTIGCLVQASPCSIGYAGRGALQIAVNGVQGAIGLKNDGVDPQVTCIRNLISNPTFPATGSLYPLARRLFINTIKGFDAVTGDERKMAVCFANRAITDNIVINRDFITLSDSAAARPTYCSDFDEHAICPGTNPTNTNECATHVSPSPFPKCGEADPAASCH